MEAKALSREGDSAGIIAALTRRGGRMDDSDA